MSLLNRLLLRLYSIALHLYPARFRSEFEDEMRSVYASLVRQALGRGKCQVADLMWREVYDLPRVVISAYTRDRRRGMSTKNMYGFQKPAPWWALLATTVLFLLPGLGVIGRWLYPLIPAPQGQYLVLGILGLLIIGFFIELFKARSFPRWGLPYAGFFLAIIFFYGLQYLVVAPLVTFWMPAVQPGDELGRLMSQALTSGYAWLFLLLCLGLVLLISAALPPLRGIARSARQDWTKLSFLLYGAVVLVYLIDFDEYQHEELYVVIGVIAFVLGAWSYLRSVTPRRRWLALLLGVTLAMLSMAVGKWIIVPSQDWPQWFQWHAPETERWFESIREIFAWGWIVLALSAPALLSLLPHAKETDLPPAQSQA